MSNTFSRILRKLGKIGISFLISLIALLLAIACGALLVKMMGKDPSVAFASIYAGSFGSRSAIGETIVKAAPIMLTAMAFAVTFKCGLLNIGAEGQIYMGGLFSMVVALGLKGLPFIIHMPLCILAGMCAGGLWGALAGWLKVRFNADEMITTIMLNYIGMQFANFMVTDVIRDKSSSIPQTERAPLSAQLPQFIPGTRIHIGVFFALACLVFYYIFLWRTKAGYRCRVVGANRYAAEFAGIKRGRSVIQTMFIAGAFSGLAGATEILGLQIRMLQNFSPGYGFDGIAAAMLGNSSPFGILISSLMFGALKAGSNMMQIMTQVPMATINLVQGLAILFVIASRFITGQMEKNAQKRKQKGASHA